MLGIQDVVLNKTFLHEVCMLQKWERQTHKMIYYNVINAMR